MFEKEAEEYEGRKHYRYEDNDYCGDIADGIIQAFQQGAEFGYNKVNEWHYMEDELPPKKVPLNIITFDKNKKRRVWVGEYDGGNGQWLTGYFNHFIDVPYAWREITIPEFGLQGDCNK